MEKERALLARLDRIDGLRRDDAPAEVLLDEVRSLLAEAEEWVSEERAVPVRAAEAIEHSREALAAGERSSNEALVAP